MSTGITFDTWHTARDWGLKLLSYHIPMPEPKEKTVDVAGTYGALDLTEADGMVYYNRREGIEILFDLDDSSAQKWLAKELEVSAAIHGQKVKMILDDQPNYYYMVRLSLDSTKSNPVLSRFVLTGSAEPFKYDSSWSFPERTMASGATVTLPAGGIGTVPVFQVSRASTDFGFSYNGKTYGLVVGRNRFPDLVVSNNAVTLKFTGTGGLSIDYRRRYL